MTLPICSLSLIGLLQGSRYICGTMTIMMMLLVIGMMMMKINLLGSMMPIKNGVLEKL